MHALPENFQAGVLSETPDLKVAILPPRGRYSLRLSSEASTAASSALGLDIPVKIGARAISGDLEIVCLGPDEWVLLCDEGRKAEIEGIFHSLYNSHPHSLVDISDRDITVEISGAKAITLLTLGWPRDPDSMPVGEARRTVFDGATVVMWRDGETCWRMNGWRSFMPHVLELLMTGCRELAAE